MEHIRVECSGPTSNDVRITIRDTGENLLQRVPIASLTLRFDPNEIPHASIEVLGPRVLVESASASYLMRHPEGGLREVARIEYRDGTTVAFPAAKNLPAKDA